MATTKNNIINLVHEVKWKIRENIKKMSSIIVRPTLVDAA